MNHMFNNMMHNYKGPEIQKGLFERAEARQKEKTVDVDSLADLKDFFASRAGFVRCFARHY